MESGGRWIIRLFFLYSHAADLFQTFLQLKTSSLDLNGAVSAASTWISSPFTRNFYKKYVAYAYTLREETSIGHTTSVIVDSTLLNITLFYLPLYYCYCCTPYNTNTICCESHWSPMLGIMNSFPQYISRRAATCGNHVRSWTCSYYWLWHVSIVLGKIILKYIN